MRHIEPVFRSRPLRVALAFCAVAAFLAVFQVGPSSQAASTNSVETVDATGDVGRHTSIVLDGSGNPVVSYYVAGLDDLRVLHCNDPDCNGGDESITSPDTAGNVGQFTSLVLDASGFPVISYYSVTNTTLKVMHCNDINCAGANESITTPDPTGDEGEYSSIALDSSGYPVISYHTKNGLFDLTVMHCNDVNCAGSDESIESPDGSATVGRYTSLALDASGNPVVSYQDFATDDLKVMHCDDANCSGGGESFFSETTNVTGLYTSLELDSVGRPVVSYYDSTLGDLKLLHCDDVNCQGFGETIETPDGIGDSGAFSSLALDSNGYPVMSHYNNSSSHLRIGHCNDANCAGSNDSIEIVDSTADVGRYSSLVLDTNGYPVVSYQDDSTADLKIIHCGDANCTGDKPLTLTVNATDDALDEICGAHCSLRDALSVAAANGGVDTIEFDQSVFPPSAPAEISILTALPAMSGDGDTIDASNAGVEIVPDGTFDCFTISGDGNTIVGLELIQGCGIGIVITGANNTVGGTNSPETGASCSNALDDDSDGYVNDGCPQVGSAPESGSQCALGDAVNDDPGNDSDVNDGCPARGQGITINNSTSRGIEITGAGAIGNTVIGNYIGTNEDGDTAAANGGSAVRLSASASNNTIGGTSAGDRNILSGNTTYGVNIVGASTTGNALIGNYIGTDVTGTTDIANTNNGVRITSPGNTIGGTSPGTRNIISGNDNNGISIEDASATGNQVLGNYVGTNAAGSAAIANFPHGISISDASGTIIGGTSAGAGNVVSGNTLGGISISGATASGNQVLGNLVGLDAGGTIAVGNFFGVGVFDRAYDNTVGGIAAGAGNVVARNTLYGVVVGAGTAPYPLGNSIRGNSIHSNGNLGIDLELAAGVTPNDVEDPDSGPNNLQNFPVLTGASTGSTIVNGSLDSTPSTLFTLDFYSNSACDGSGNGEGETYLGSTDVATDNEGYVEFSTALAVTSLAGEFVTATATDPGGNTSEFSACVTVSGAPAGEVVGVPDTPGFNGDGPGATTLVNGPTGMYETGTANSLYFADTVNNLARKHKADGTVATLAGIDPNLAQTPCAGSIGDGCPARQAVLSGPRDVFVHTNGDLYIADRNNCRIRKVVGGADNVVNGDNSDEVITTVAGDGNCGYGGDGGQATSAQINRPTGVAVDVAGNIYIADTDNHRVRRVDAGTGVITTVAGDGNTGTGDFGDGGAATNAQLNLPHDVFFVRPGEEDLLIADTLHHRIRRLDIDSGAISTVAGTTSGFSGDGGAALNAQLNGPEAVASAEDRIFIADTKNNRIRRVNILTGIIDTIIGDGGLTTTVTLDDPQGVAIGGGIVGVSNTERDTLITATIDPDTGDSIEEFTPTQSCGILPGVSSIDWALPIGLLGLVIVRKRITTLFVQLGTAIRLLPGRLNPGRAILGRLRWGQ